MASGSSSDTDTYPEYLDPRSPKFDPRRALYDKHTPLLSPDAKQFNNLCEFENYLQGKDAISLKKANEAKQKEKAQLPGIIAVRAAAQAREAVRKAAILQKTEGPSEKSRTQERRLRQTNVFTRMEGFKQGPLSLLRRCVEDRLRVVVVVRAAVAVRSRCRGYVVAFDKHFNIALMDVDEKLIRPIPQKMRGEKKKSSQSENSSEQTKTKFLCSEDSGSEKCSVDLREKLKLSQGSKWSPKHDSRQGSSSKYTGKDKYRTEPGGSKNKLDEEVWQVSGTSRDNSHSRAEVKDASKESDKIFKSSSSKNSGEGKSKSERSRTKADRDEKSRSSDKRSQDFKEHFKNYLSDSNVYVERQKKLLQSRETKSDTEGQHERSKSRPKKGTDPLKKTFQPFWPIYRKWTEGRCYAEYEIVSRHVNQLFIRGDNVVSVSIADG